MILGRIVEFPNRQGQLLRGILHEPDSRASRGVCVLLLSPGIKGRVGPHRLYLKLAARFVSNGFHVLRFDYSGLGDSAGEIPERMLADVYASIQTGRYVDDTVSAMNWLQTTHGVRRFVGSGLCGGSISALLTAEGDRRIECLLGISLPTVLEGGPENWARVLTQQQIESMSPSYFRKLTDPKSWLRLLSGKSDFKVIWRVLKDLPSRWSQQAIRERSPPEKAEIDNTNPRFAEAFIGMLTSRRPMLLLFSGADRLHGQFEENFSAHHADELSAYRHIYDLHVVQRANHILSDPVWVSELLAVADRWLDDRYPAR